MHILIYGMAAVSMSLHSLDTLVVLTPIMCSILMLQDGITGIGMYPWNEKFPQQGGGGTDHL